jgi:hypothetical protein
VSVKGKWNIKVAKFAQDHGKWYPAEGYHTNEYSNGHVERKQFRIVEFAYNTGPGAYTAEPRLSQGTVVQDEIRHVLKINGGINARRAFEQKYNLSPEKRLVVKPNNVFSVANLANSLSEWLLQWSTLTVISLGLIGIASAVHIWKRVGKGPKAP